MCAPVSLRFCSLLGLAMAPALTGQSQGFSTLPESPASSPTDTTPTSSHSSTSSNPNNHNNKKLRPGSPLVQPSAEDNRLERKLDPPLTNGNHSPTLGCHHVSSEEDGASSSMGPMGFADKVGGVAPDDVDFLFSHLDSVGENHVADLLDAALDAEAELKTEAPPNEVADLGLSEAELAVLAARLTEQHLLNLCDVTEPSTTSDVTDSMLSREEIASERLAEVSKRQEGLVRRYQRLLRRAQKLQARQTARHVTWEVQQSVKLAQTSHLSLVPPRPQMEEQLLASGRFPRREDVRHISTAALVNLVKRLEAPTASLLRSKKYFASGRTPVSHSQTNASAGGALQLLGEEVGVAAGQWAAQLNHLQRALDEDLTASSSGGESGDESQPYVLDCYSRGQKVGLTGEAAPNPSCPVWRRACWRWGKERAALAARWVWLQAQVADLEYRIRQHTEIVRQLRSAKGILMFEGAEESTPSLTTPTTTTVVTAAAEERYLPGCARTRPLVTSAFRKRRLVRPGLPVTSLVSPGSNPNAMLRKALRLSAVKCQCLPREVTPCVLCSGRKHFRVPIEPDFMTVRERVARVDPAFHPILSAMHEVSVGDHVGSLLKNQDWRREAARARRTIALATLCPPPNSAHAQISIGTSPLSAPSLQPHGPIPQHLTNNHHPNSMTDAVDGRKKKRGRRPFKHQRYQRGASCDTAWEEPSSYKKRKRFQRLSSGASRASDWDRDDWLSPDSPCPSSQSSHNTVQNAAGTSRDRGSTSSSVYQDLLRRKSGYDYDIDDIVIPYSMAASTRVERLQYKEILTPKWRLVDNDHSGPPLPSTPVILEESPSNSGGTAASGAPLVEDLSEDTILQRHDRSEVEERKKFMSYLKPKGSRARARANRTDSRADSSGANTPDPQWPHEVGENEPPSPSVTGMELVESHQQRRRMNSLSKSKVGNTSATNLSSWEESSCSAMEGAWSYESVAPYDPRQFPLPDSTVLDMAKEMPEEGEEEGGGGGGERGGAIKEEKIPNSTTKPEYEEEKIEQNRPSSRASSTDTFETASALEDDPDDPEWNGSRRGEDAVVATPTTRQNPRR